MPRMAKTRRQSRTSYEAGAAWALLSLCATLTVLPLASCAKKPNARSQRVSVTVARAERRDMPVALSSTGTVEPIKSAAVGSQVGGVITRVEFREGDDVRAGQVLLQLDPRPFRTALEQAQAALQRSRAERENARLDAQRAEALFQRQMISQTEWDQKRTTAEAMAASARSDSASMMKARLDLEYSTIRAPVGGRTGRLMVHQGDFVKAATSDPLVTINQSRPVRVAFTVPGSDVPLVQRYRASGHPTVWVTTSNSDSATLQGTLSFVDNAVDPASGTLLLKGEFPNRDLRLIPGQFVSVRLVLTTESSATVRPPALRVHFTAPPTRTCEYGSRFETTISRREARCARAHSTSSSRVERGGPSWRCWLRTAARLRAVRRRSGSSITTSVQ